MDLPFCKICGERHRLGCCPLYDEPPEPRHEQARQAAIEEPEAASPDVAAKDPWREIYDQARAFSPEDMKQEEMPVTRPRFDRNAYQRELMRKRYHAAKSRQSVPTPDATPPGEGANASPGLSGE